MEALLLPNTILAAIEYLSSELVNLRVVSYWAADAGMLTSLNWTRPHFSGEI